MTKKILGDAGEHYAIAKFSFAGAFCSKMPDNWPAYDIFLQKGDSKFCVSVKTRSETASFGPNSYFKFDAIDQSQWFVCITYVAGQIDSWIIPTSVAKKKFKRLENVSRGKPVVEYKTTVSQLRSELMRFKENWALDVVQ
ncbi:MAG: hypothetical protein ACOYBW_05355 [Fluviibacter phosphoraccumulans]